MRKIKLNRFKNKMASDADTFTSLHLSSTFNEINETEISRVINQTDVYYSEKNASETYRLVLNVKPLLTNILPNLTTPEGISIFNNPEFKRKLNPINSGLNKKSNLTFKDSYNIHLKEKNGWLGFNKPNGLTLNQFFTELEPKKYDLELFDEDDYENWSFGLYYISSKEHFSSDKGCPLIMKKTLDYGGGRMLACVLSCFDHNLSIGDKVFIGGLTNSNGEYTILDIGDENNKNKESYFVVDIPAGANITNLSYFKRNTNGIHSEYYKRILKPIPTSQVSNKNKYEIMESGFAQSIYEDQICNILFKEDINLSNLVDYRNRIPMEIIVVCFKNRESKDGTQMFTRLKSGFNLSDNQVFDQRIPNVRKINSNNYNYFIEDNILLGAGELCYDFVELNKWEVSEYKLNSVSYRFNTTDRERNVAKPLNDNGEVYDLGVRNEGYCYNPFYSFELRGESDYVESGDEFDELPYYAIEIEPNSYKWRDVLDKSNSEQSNPFLNGSNYLFGIYDLHQKRQDPFGNFGLFYKNFPSDKSGTKDTSSEDDVTIDNINNEC